MNDLVMQILIKYKFRWLLLFLLNSVSSSGQNISTKFLTIESGIVRGATDRRQIALVFTADEWFEGFDIILRHLKKDNISAGFFLTGRLYRNPEAYNHIRKAKKAGHYLGPHSDMHLLYNDWVQRDSLLVTHDSMLSDLRQNLSSMECFGIDHREKLFIPPYEWWNRAVAAWCLNAGWKVMSFTPGTFTNADYTTPDMGEKYRSTDTLIQRLFRKESTEGLNGAILLIHLGTDPRRTDKFYDRLPELIARFKDRGYRFERIDRMIGK